MNEADRLKQAELALARSEERFRQMADLLPNAIGECGPDLKLSYLNQKAMEYFGYAEQDLADGIPVQKLVHSSQLPQLARLWKQIRGGDKIEGLELLLQSKDGSLLRGHINAAPIIDGGKVSGLRLSCQDISELHSIRTKAEESANRYRLIFDNTETGLAVLEDDMTISSANATFAKMCGLPRQQIEGHRKWVEFLSKRDQGRTVHYHRLRRIRPDMAPRSYQVAFRSIKGELKDIFLTLTMIPGTASSIVSLLDITDMIGAKRSLEESEQRYRSFFQNNRAVMLVLDAATGNIVDANTSACRFYGYGHHKLTSMKIQDICVMDSQSVMANLNASRLGLSHYFRQLDSSGREIDVDVYSSPLAMNGRKMLLTIVHDISGQRKTEAERSILAAAIEQAGESVMITDINGFILYVNPGFERITGYTRDEALGQKPSLLKSGKQDQAFYGRLWRSVKQGKAWSGRTVNKAKGGRLFVVEQTISPLRDQDGRITNFVATARDITEELELRRSLRQAQKMEAIGTLAGGIAHDFNNILAIILTSAEMALKSIEPDHPGKLRMQRVMKAGLRAKDLVKQILSISRRKDEEISPVEPAPVFKEAMKMLRSILPSTIEIRHSIGGQGCHVEADPSELHQVLMNLCVNAAQAMPDGGVLEVSLQVIEPAAPGGAACPQAAPGPYLCLCVRDSGKGMEPALLERIFEPYFTTKDVGDGTGLGLAVTNSIVMRCGGKVSVDSEPGKGSTFQVVLPVIQPKESKPPQAAAWAEPPQGQGRVLLVDDEPMLMEAAKDIIESLGYIVTGFTDSTDALEAFQNEPEAYDLVFTDQTMPHLTGIELVEKIRAAGGRTPVIICTGYSDRLSDEKLVDLEVPEVIPKPFERDDLGRVLQRALLRRAAVPARESGKSDCRLPN